MKSLKPKFSYISIDDDDDCPYLCCPPEVEGNMIPAIKHIDKAYNFHNSSPIKTIFFKDTSLPVKF